jgi:alkylation response protein AidB-like acyl-CoA dehydrogenase
MRFHGDDTMAGLDVSLVAWIDEHAEGLDTGTVQADALLARLAQAGLFTVAVPESEGGDGRALSAAVDVVAGLAEHSLSAAFVFWAQRAFIACLQASPNRDLVRRLMPDLLHGRLAGAPGLSNAMKFLGGLDRLRTAGMRTSEGVRLNGTVPWATNLRRQGFVAAIAAGDEHGDNPSVFALPHDAPGVQREPDLDLLALRGTNTAALRLDDVALEASWQIHPQARVFLPGIRPAFVGLQCGLGPGLARAALRAARAALDGRSSVLSGEIDALDADIAAYRQTLCAGLDDGSLRERPRDLLALRLRMVALASDAVALELQALGGRALLRAANGGYARRAREAAFLAVVTPTVAQLKGDLARLAQA